MLRKGHLISLLLAHVVLTASASTAHQPNVQTHAVNARSDSTEKFEIDREIKNNAFKIGESLKFVIRH